MEAMGKAAAALQDGGAWDTNDRTDRNCSCTELVGFSPDAGPCGVAVCQS